jgi:5,10-methylenetetrahydromethanopterin reductase
MVTAAALATLAGLAPGRVSAAFGTGLTGRLLLGERPMRWAEVGQYVQAVRALLRGEETSWKGSVLRMTHPAGFAAGRPADVAVLIAADGPKGAAVAAELGDGTLSTRVPKALARAEATRPGEAHRQVLLAFGTVLGDDEDPSSARVIAAAGPAFAAACHASYEAKGAAGVDRLPGGREAVEAVDEPRRHLAIHDGHLAVLGEYDEALLARAAPLLAKWTMTGTRAELVTRLAQLSSAGVSEIAYQPMGPDIARELAAFAEAAGLRAGTGAAGTGGERG